jgi:hypothetical protein
MTIKGSRRVIHRIHTNETTSFITELLSIGMTFLKVHQPRRRARLGEQGLSAASGPLMGAAVARSWPWQ